MRCSRDCWTRTRAPVSGAGDALDDLRKAARLAPRSQLAQKDRFGAGELESDAGFAEHLLRSVRGKANALDLGERDRERNVDSERGLPPDEPEPVRQHEQSADVLL